MPICHLKIQYANQSAETVPFESYLTALEYARDGISYSGGMVARVELDMKVSGGGVRALWDATWNDESKAIGINPPY